MTAWLGRLTDRPLMFPPGDLPWPDVEKRLRIAAEFGVSHVWTDQRPGTRDAMIVADRYLHTNQTWSCGTAVVPIRPIHPVVLAQSANTLTELSGGRFVLGVGYSHRLLNEHALGLAPTSPLDTVTEYLAALRPLVAEGRNDYEGPTLSARQTYEPFAGRTPVFLAALRPRMIRAAVRMADGLLLWLVSPEYVAQVVMPFVRDACEQFGKDPDTFNVSALVPCYVGSEPDRFRESAAAMMSSYSTMPYYGRLLETQAEITGSASPADVAGRIAPVGAASLVRDRMEEFAQLGCTAVPGPMPGSESDFATTLGAVYG